MRTTKLLLISIFSTLLMSTLTLADNQEPIEASTSSKRPADKGYYLGLGPIGLWNLNSAGLGYYVTTGYAFDVDQLTMKLGGEFFGRAGALGLVGSIGISYFPDLFNNPDCTPFAGLDFGYGTARVNASGAVLGDWVAAFVLGPQVGVQLFRTANVNLELALKWGFFLSSGPLGSPSYSLFRVSLYFM